MNAPRTDAIDCTVDEQDSATSVTLTLDRPDKLNALTPDQTADLIDRLDSMSADDADAVVVTGAGEEFSTGADVSSFDPEDDGGFPNGMMHDLVDAVRGCPVPVVCRVRGRAFGLGFMICMAADVVVAAEDAEFGLQEVNFGMPAEGYVTTLLPRIVGEHYTREWLLTGAVVPADRAHAAGFVTHLVPAGDLDDEVSALLCRFADSSRAAMAALKTRMADPGLPGGMAAIRERERADLVRAYESGEVAERLAAFVDS